MHFYWVQILGSIKPWCGSWIMEKTDISQKICRFFLTEFSNFFSSFSSFFLNYSEMRKFLIISLFSGVQIKVLEQKIAVCGFWLILCPFDPNPWIGIFLRIRILSTEGKKIGHHDLKLQTWFPCIKNNLLIVDICLIV